MTIKQVQAKFIFDVENQKLINPYDIFTGKATSTDFKCVNFDGKPCWTVTTWQSGSGLAYQITFTKEIIKLEFDYYIDNIDGFCILFGINIDESTKYHLTNVSKSYPSYGNYVWWNPDKSQISDGILNVNTWFHFVIEGNKIQIYNMSGELLYERNKVDNVIQSIELKSDANYTPYIANMVATFNYSQSYLDTIGLTTLWSKIKSLFATKTELSNGLNSKANDSEVVHKSGDETIAGSKTFSSKIVGDLQGNADTATKATTADSATNATNAVNCPNYLPLSGGNLTNNFVGRNVDNSFLHLSSCTDSIKGAMLVMYGENYTEWIGGGFRLISRNSSTICELDGYPNGTLSWNGTVISSSDNTCDLGRSNYRFKDIYATNATINTSDRNAKQDISVIEDKLLDAWGNINPVTFKLISSVEQKGDNARVHTGYIAQDVKEELDKYGIDACKYGLFCYNSWDAQEERSHEEERTDEEGNTETVKVIDIPARDAGETYGLRYIECLIVECAYLRKKNKELEDRIIKLEENLNA